MKTILPKLLKSIGVTLTLICIVWLVLAIFGVISLDVMKIVASICSMYGFPIILGNLLLLNSEKPTLNQQPKLITQIFKSALLSMAILFTVNFVLWVIVWGAPIADLFKERNMVFYLIGFCILIVISVLFHVISFRVFAKKTAL